MSTKNYFLSALTKAAISKKLKTFLCDVIFLLDQCGRNGRFLNFLLTNFLTKVAQIFWYLL